MPKAQLAILHYIVFLIRFFVLKQVVKSKEYRKQLFELKLNGVALQFLIGRQLTGYLAKPGHDIREFLEVCFHPEEKAKQRKKTEMAIGKLSRKVDAVGGCMQVLREFEVSYAYAKEESVKVEKMVREIF